MHNHLYKQTHFDQHRAAVYNFRATSKTSSPFIVSNEPKEEARQYIYSSTVIRVAAGCNKVVI